MIRASYPPRVSISVAHECWRCHVASQSDRTLEAGDVAGYSAPSLLYFLVIVVQARGDYGGKMLETMREVRHTPPAATTHVPAACSAPTPHHLLP